MSCVNWWYKNNFMHNIIQNNGNDELYKNIILLYFVKKFIDLPTWETPIRESFICTIAFVILWIDLEIAIIFSINVLEFFYTIKSFKIIFWLNRSLYHYRRDGFSIHFTNVLILLHINELKTICIDIILFL